MNLLIVNSAPEEMHHQLYLVNEDVNVYLRNS